MAGPSDISLQYLVKFRSGQDYKHVADDAGTVPVYGSGGPFATASDHLYDGESVLFGRKGTIDRPLHVSGKFWTVDTMFYTELSDAVDGRWLHYWATTIPFSVYSMDTALPSMTSSVLGRLKVPFIDVEDQRTVADYLDRETAQIDTLIAEQQRLIELLHERRESAVIAAVVGTDQDSPERFGTWFGVLPTEWKAGQIRNFGEVALGKMLQSSDTGNDLRFPYLRAANVQPFGVLQLDDVKEMWFSSAEQRALTLRRGDVVVVEGGIGGYGRAAYLTHDLDGFGFQNSINRIRPSADNDGRYVAYAINAARSRGFIAAYCNVVSMPHLTAEKLARFPIPLPPAHEQRRIADELDELTAKIDTLIAEAERFIELAKERRSALITAAVTGQINIPGAAQ